MPVRVVINPSRNGNGIWHDGFDDSIPVVVIDSNAHWLSEQSELQWRSGDLSRRFFKCWDISQEGKGEQLVALLAEFSEECIFEADEQDWDILQQVIKSARRPGQRFSHQLPIRIDEVGEVTTPVAIQAVPDRLGVVLVHIDNFAVTQECLLSIEATSYPDKLIVVLDNASHNLSAVELFLRFPGVMFLSAVARTSYTHSFNLLADFTIRNGAEYLFISNNDTRGHSPDIFQQLKSALTKSIGVASPVIFDFEGNLLRNGLVVHFGVEFPIATEAYLIPVSVWKQLDGFRQSYNIYCEDVDMLLRLRALRLDGTYVDAVELQHLQNATTRNKIFLRTYFYLRNVVWIQKVKRVRVVRNILYFGLQEFLAIVRSLWRATHQGDIVQLLLGFPYLIAGGVAGVLSKPRENRRADLSRALLRTTWELKYRIR